MIGQVISAIIAVCYLSHYRTVTLHSEHFRPNASHLAPIYEEIYQDMVKLTDANTEHGDKLEKILTMVELITLIACLLYTSRCV